MSMFTVDWAQKDKTLWTAELGGYRVVMYSYEDKLGRSLFWYVFDSQRDIASGSSSNFNDAQRLAAQQLRALVGNNTEQLAVGV